MSIVKNGDGKKGKLNVEWAERNMGALMLVKNRMEKEKPFRGMKIGCCLHVTKETGALARTLKAGGAEVYLSASNPLSTTDDVAAYLVEEGIEVYAFRAQSEKDYWECIGKVVSAKPDVTIDDGADLTVKMHERKMKALGGTEETTTGVIRLRALAREGMLAYPVIAVNDAKTKMMFDNRYGTGQSTLDGILRATGILLAGKTFVVAGYGWCGRGVANKARGMGARVIVTEVNPTKALEAVMDGFNVKPMNKAVEEGDVFVTATGDSNVIGKEHMMRMKDGAILCNSGHFNVEVNVSDLEKIAKGKREIRSNMVEYRISDELGKEKILFLLGEGRLVNLACAEGHPSEVMQMSFSNQALAAEYILKNGSKMEKKVHEVPEEIDEQVAAFALQAMKIEIDELSKEQKKYLESW